MGSIRPLNVLKRLRVSEDATLMMARVQQHQGQASYVVFGTQLAAGHHNEKFDFDEQVLAIAVETLARTALGIFHWTRGIDAGNLSFYRRCD